MLRRLIKFIYSQYVQYPIRYTVIHFYREKFCIGLLFIFLIFFFENLNYIQRNCKSQRKLKWCKISIYITLAKPNYMARPYWRWGHQPEKANKSCINYFSINPVLIDMNICESGHLKTKLNNYNRIRYVTSQTFYI